jgi:hypothetical protein
LPALAALAPTPELTSDLEADGIDGLLRRAPKRRSRRCCGMAGKYLEVQAQRQPGARRRRLEERELWVVTSLHAFYAQLRGAVERLTHIGRLRPFGIALAQRKVLVGERSYQGFASRTSAEPASDLKPVAIDSIVGNQEFLQAGLRLARDVAAYDLEQRRSPKRLNPVLFGLGRPGCGKTLTAYAIANYFLSTAASARCRRGLR